METKKCTDCGKELPIEKFNKNKNHKDGYQYQCKACLSEYKKQYREKNKESLKEIRHKYYIDNKEHENETSKKYREEHWDVAVKTNYYRVYYEENKDKYKMYRSLWIEKNPDKHRCYNQKRRALKKALIATLTESQWNKIKEHFNGRCCYCNRELPLEQEHAIPLSSMGELTINNILPACKSCNSSKGAKDMISWYRKYKHYSKAREKKILDFLGYNGNIQQLKLG